MSELQGLQSRISEFKALGYQVVAVSPDPVDENRKVVARLKLDYPLLFDENLELTKDLNLVHPGAAPAGHDVPRPATYVIYNNEIQWEYLTDNWRVRPHVDDLLEVVEAL